MPVESIDTQLNFVINDASGDLSNTEPSCLLPTFIVPNPYGWHTGLKILRFDVSEYIDSRYGSYQPDPLSLELGLANESNGRIALRSKIHHQESDGNGGYEIGTYMGGSSNEEETENSSLALDRMKDLGWNSVGRLL
jgi:hypothetical protein